MKKDLGIQTLNPQVVTVPICGAPDEVVDMKRAVPEGDMDSAPTTRLCAAGRFREVAVLFKMFS